jgi:hypothetical protein
MILTVCIRACICHCQDACTCESQLRMYFVFAVIKLTESGFAPVREENNDTVLYTQFLAIDARSSSTGSRWISTLNHKILFEPSWVQKGLRTKWQVINIQRWYDGTRLRCSTLVSQVLRSFCMSNNISSYIWLECWVRRKKHTRGAWSQYNSSCTSPKFVSSMTESLDIKDTWRTWTAVALSLEWIIHKNKHKSKRK